MLPVITEQRGKRPTAPHLVEYYSSTHASAVWLLLLLMQVFKLACGLPNFKDNHDGPLQDDVICHVYSELVHTDAALREFQEERMAVESDMCMGVRGESADLPFDEEPALPPADLHMHRIYRDYEFDELSVFRNPPDCSLWSLVPTSSRTRTAPLPVGVLPRVIGDTPAADGAPPVVLDTAAQAQVGDSSSVPDGRSAACSPLFWVHPPALDRILQAADGGSSCWLFVPCLCVCVLVVVCP